MYEASSPLQYKRNGRAPQLDLQEIMTSAYRKKAAQQLVNLLKAEGHRSSCYWSD